MGFLENIFPLIVIYLVWKVFNKAQKAGQEEGEQEAQPRPPAPAEGEYGQVDVRELLRQILLGGEAAQPRPVPPPQPRPAPREAIVAVPQGRRPSLIREETPARQTRREKAGRREKPEAPAAVRPAPRAAAPEGKPCRPGRPCFSPRKLRQAVIWSEILARPVALRE